MRAAKPSTRELACVVAVARLGSFSAAGSRLSMTQQGVSRSIAGLEARCGVRLFERTTHWVRLTDAGESFLELATAADTAIERATRWLEARSARCRPLVHIGYTVSARRLVVEHLASALERRRWTADCVEMPTSLQESELLAGRLELAFLHPPLENAALASRWLGSEPLIAVLPPEHPLSGRDEVTLKELAGERWWLFDRRQGPWLHDRVVSALSDASGARPRIEAYLMPHAVRADAAVPLMSEHASFARCRDLRLELAVAWDPSAGHEGRDEALDLVERLSPDHPVGL